MLKHYCMQLAACSHHMMYTVQEQYTLYMMYMYNVCKSCIYNVRAYISHLHVQHYMHSYIHVHVHEYYIFTIVHVHMYVHVLMRDEKKGRKKQARSYKQTTRHGNTAHLRQ